MRAYFILCSAIQKTSERSSHAANKRWTERKSPVATLLTNIHTRCTLYEKERPTENSACIHVERPLLYFSHSNSIRLFTFILCFYYFFLSLASSLDLIIIIIVEYILRKHICVSCCWWKWDLLWWTERVILGYTKKRTNTQRENSGMNSVYSTTASEIYRPKSMTQCMESVCSAAHIYWLT